ncbi:hypothetical protein [Pseudonocardia acidicola]|uniref:Uncharacterized protein n=1 Tax=Pseudonocardia acidicola TaxID=2724939 RepID=A0ABX1S866_9PSEU|nr:hypothetical protein [Pseudonocardia acidicola]NMH96358.1 hypothetical protein [Pseudonocardia acidicola]
MTGEPQNRRPAEDRADDGEQALSVLRGIWSAQGQTSAELEERFGTGHTKVCKNMKDIGFGGMAPDAVAEGPDGTNTPVGSDLRSAWRNRLEREGKLHPHAVSIGETIRRDAAR